jgi:hypothetical protein
VQVEIWGLVAPLKILVKLRIALKAPASGSAVVVVSALVGLPMR